MLAALKVFWSAEGQPRLAVWCATLVDKKPVYGSPWPEPITVPTARHQIEAGLSPEPLWSVEIAQHDVLAASLGPTTETVPVEVLTALRPHPARPRPDIDSRLPLMPFQREGVAFALRCDGRCLIADEMGLGKTFQGLAVWEYYRTEYPALIVCPAVVKANWTQIVKTYFPEEPVNCIDTGQNDFDPHGLNIMSFGMITSPIFQAKLRAFQPRVLIVDESHYVKTARAARTKQIFHWSQKAVRVVLLTGTPMNRPHELYSQIKCINRQIYRQFFHHQKHSPLFHFCTPVRHPPFYFATRYCGPELKQVRGHESWLFKRASNEHELHAVLRHNLMIRRTKKEVLTDLPPKIREKVLIDVWRQNQIAALEVNQGDFMERVRETAQHKLPLILAYCQEILLEELHNDVELKVLVWAHHHFLLDDLRHFFEARSGFTTVAMDGRTPLKQRQTSIEAFQTDPNVRVAILGYTAMQTGVTLTAATLQICCELVFLPDVHLQSEDRAYRIGTTSPVTVRYLISEGSTDTIVWRLLSQKVQTTSLCLDGQKHDTYGWSKTKQQ